MRYRVIWLLCLMFLTAAGASAQEADEWFLAWGIEGQIISYTPDGETQILIPENVSNDQFRAWRMDDGSVLLMVELADGSDERELYHVTQTAATPITIAAEGADWLRDSNRQELLVNSGSYAVLVASGNLPAGVGLLINLEDHSARLLAEQVMFTVGRVAAFSQDGLYLRYLGNNGGEDEAWTLRELKLETGDERVFYTVEDDSFPIMSTDQYGEQWLYTRRLTSYAISRSGEYEVTLYEAPENILFQRFVGDYLISYPLLCEVDCVLEWKRTPDGETQTFQLPDSDGALLPNPLAQVGDSQLLILADQELWLLSQDEEPAYLGAWSAQTVVAAPDKAVSPDGRWLLVLDDAESADAYRVLDLQSGETIVEGDPERHFHILQPFYGQAGFIVSEDLLYFQYYRSSDGQVFDLGEPTGVYWYVLADGTLLFNHYREDDMARGIYRYDPDTGDYTLLLENAISVAIKELTP